MSSLCAKHRQQVSHSPLQAINYVKQCMNCGTAHHNNRNYHQACRHFSQALEISQLLIDLKPLEGSQNYLSLKIAAAHNLATSYAALGQLADAGETLTDLHHSLLKLCLAPAIPRSLRLTALGALDNSLFSLTSNLGSRGKIDQLYQIIDQTDQAAELAAAQLLH